MRGFSYIFCFLLALLVPDVGAESAVPDTAGGDSVAVAPQDSVVADFVRQQKIDPAYAWKLWKELSRAIALRALDGPDDILEKAEIIQDRRDDLLEEKKKIKAASKEWEERHQALELQLEVLDDLAEIQRGGDLQLQQRMHSLREDRGKALRRLRVFRGSLRDLDREVGSMAKLAEEYREKAADLRRREEEGR